MKRLLLVFLILSSNLFAEQGETIQINNLKVTVTGEQKVIAVEFLDESILQHPDKCGKAIAEAFNKAIEKSQQIAAEEMKSVMGGMGLPGA